MLEKGTFILNEEEEYIEEGFLGFGKKKSRWQRIKDRIKRRVANPKRLAANVAGGIGGHILFNKAYKYKYGDLPKDNFDRFAHGNAIGLGAHLGDAIYAKMAGEKYNWED